jgi:hypothetical protein
VTRLLTESSVRLAEIKSDCPRRRVIMVSGPDTERRPKYTIKASLKDPTTIGPSPSPAMLMTSRRNAAAMARMVHSLVNQLFIERLFSMLQTRHFRGFPSVDFRGVFCMGWRMAAITTPRLARARAYAFGKVRTRKISLDHLVCAR